MKSWQTIFAILLIFGCLIYLSYRSVWTHDKTSGSYAINQPNLPPPSQEDVLTFCADFFMPLTGAAGTEHEGYAIDLLRNIYEPLGYSINYRNAPWRRCIRDARDGLVSAIVGASGEEAPDFIFPDTKIGKIEMVFFTRGDEKWTYSDMSSLEKLRLGIIRDYTYTDSLDEYIFENMGSERILAISEEDPIAKLVELLTAEKIDVFAEDIHTVKFFLDRHPEFARQIKSVAGLNDAKFPRYVAFSPILPTSDYLSELFDLRMAELEQYGLLQATLDKYDYSPSSLLSGDGENRGPSSGRAPIKEETSQ